MILLSMTKVKTPFFHWDLIQGSEEWFNFRLGKITGSIVKTLLVRGRGENGFGVGAFTKLYEIVEVSFKNNEIYFFTIFFFIFCMRRNC